MTQAALNKLRILFVDDEAPIREVMKIELQRMGHDAIICEDGKSAIAAAEKHSFDAAIVDLRMPGLTGWDVIEHLKVVSPDTDVIISTGHGNMEDAIQALRRGAYDFLTKPTKLAVISGVLNRVAEKRALKNKAIALESRLKAVEGSNIVGTSAPMLRVQHLIEKIAPTDSNVLILGETGTGKELAARRVHELSRRAHMPFVAVNCGALPENLVESELFGHRKGAFTGADTNRKGLIEVANGGTLFLDELGELDRMMQVKLLRVLELLEMVECGAFREDLFFRVNTFEIPLPSLRERKSDIPDLARALVARHLKRAAVPDGMLSPDLLLALEQHDWNGNVRELANALEHAIILSDGKTLRREDLPASVLSRVRRRPAAAAVLPLAEGKPVSDRPKSLREIEMAAIFESLERNGGDKPKTAQELGIALKTLYNKLNQSAAHAEAG
ncbi:MAG: sigma-54 dependent transcriptional regulator [Planctomycetota bacterium]|nr:sigma-54 dependent transcriptional regulator [Planctomycetota bacterium]